MNYERLAEKLVERPYNRGTVRRAAAILKREIAPFLLAINEASQGRGDTVLKLGSNQRTVLDGLHQFNGWNAFTGRWVLSTPGKTARVCERLTQLGLAKQVGTHKLGGYPCYQITEKGRQLVTGPRG